MTVDKIETVPALNIFKSLEKMFHLFSLTGWAIMCIVFICLFIAFLCILFRTKSYQKKVVLHSRIIFYLLDNRLFSNCSPKAEMKKKSKIRSGFFSRKCYKLEPNLKSESIFFLHEGTKVMLIDSSNAYWAKIKLQDGRVGWISSDSFKPI